MTTTPKGIVDYYVGLLITQYFGLTRASATVAAQAAPAILPQTSVQTLSFSSAPTSGTLGVSWNDSSDVTIHYNDSASTIQTALRTIAGLSSVTVTGSISGLLLTVTFTAVDPPAALLSVDTNSLLNGATPVTVTVAETDETLPLAVQDGFNLTGASPAIGVQLDALGKYAGVARNGVGFASQITLSDSDFLSLILVAIIKNNSGSSLATIQALIAQAFPGGEMLVYDYTDMSMSYAISTIVGSQSLVQLFVTEGILPKPMGVFIRAIIYTRYVANAFSFRTYILPSALQGFNNYSTYNTTWPWISYANVIL